MNTQEMIAALTNDELIDSLLDLEDQVPRSIIDECVYRGEPIEQRLIALLEEYFAEKEYDEFGTEWRTFHAIMILGLFSSERAGRTLVSALQAITSSRDDFLQDWLAGYWPALLRNKPTSSLEALPKLIGNRNTDEHLRIACIELTLYSAQRQGAAVLDRCLHWIASLVIDDQETLEFRMIMATHLLEFPRHSHRALVDQHAGKECFLGIMYSHEDVQRAYDRMQDTPEFDRFADPWDFYSPLAIEERLKRWKEPEQDEELGFDYPFADNPFELTETVVRMEPKIGRNDACPCGSGKKYKKCCL